MIFTGDLHGGYPSLLHHIKDQASYSDALIIAEIYYRPDQGSASSFGCAGNAIYTP